MSEGKYAYFEDVNLGLLRLWGKRTGLRVLDVGCGYATTSAELQKLGNHVAGIEESEVAVSVARTRIAEVFACDLQNYARVWELLGDARFDAILFADVLEHLPRPLPILAAYRQFLTDGGSVFISLPNIALWSVRLQLLAGRFEYEDTGVLDRTHMRFFTPGSARRMIEKAGFRVVATTHNPGLVRPFVPLAKRFMARQKKAKPPDPLALLQSPAYRAYVKVVHPVERAVTRTWPGALAFQTIFEAKPA